MGVLTLEEYKKRKKDEEGVESGVLTLDEWNSLSHKQTKTTEAKKEEKEDTNSWFKLGTLDDGYQFGDIIGGILGTAGDVVVNAGKGVSNMVEGVVDLAGYGTAGIVGLFNDDMAQSIKQATMESQTDRLFGGIENEVDKYSFFGDKADGIGQGIGYIGGIMATAGLGASAGLGSVGTSILTNSTIFASGMGSGMGEAYNSNATDEEAVMYGAISGAGEVISEMMFGGLGKGVKALGISHGLSQADDILAKTLSNKVNSQIAKNFIEFGVKASAEGTEEVLSGVISAFGKKLTYMEEEEIGQLLKDEKLLDQFITGAITSGIAQSGYVPGMKNGSLREANKNKTDFITGYTQNEQKLVDEMANAKIEQAEKDGNKLTKKEKNQIFVEVENQLKRGEIDSDTINKMFGGDSYTEMDTLTKESKEYEELLDIADKDLTGRQRKRLAELETKNTEKSFADQILETESKLKETVKNATQNDMYLQESFAEQGRRSEAFTVSEEQMKKYSEKERAIVQKAIDYGEMNNTRKAHEFVDLVAKLSADKGVDFDFTNNEKLKNSGFALEGKTINGFKQGNNIVVNMQSKNALNTVVGHEITHVLEGTELYQSLQDTVIEYAKQKGVYDSMYKDIVHLYRNQFQDNDLQTRKALYDSEITADLVGQYIFNDVDFVRNLSTKNQNVFQKVFNEIKYMLKSVKAGSDAEKQLLKAKKIFEDVYRDTKKNTSKDVQYSVSKTTDNKGRTLTKEQQEKFKDSVVRDENGNLKSLYHGTTSMAFTEFNIENGVWLSETQSYAEVYAGNWHSWRDDYEDAPKRSDINGLEKEVYNDEDLRVYELYADIQNPFNIGEINGTLSDGKISELANALGHHIADKTGDMKEGGKIAREVRNLAKDYVGEKAYSFTRTKEFIDYVKQLGFDGLEATENGKKTYCVFNSADQVKLVTNQEPTDNPDIRFSLSDNIDSEYMKAVESGDMETAQRLVKEASERAGYNTDTSWRMQHSAPNPNDDISLVDLKNSDLVPSDYWQHPDWYTHTPLERESFFTLKNALEKQERSGEDVGIWVYRAVDKTRNTKEESVRNGDWVTPSYDYAVQEGNLNPKGYRIIKQYAKLKDLYWDGNSIAELGYDDGKAYAYKDTKNNRKSLETVTYDDDGNIIPLSKRFNYRKADERYSMTDNATSTAPIKNGIYAEDVALEKPIAPMQENLENTDISWYNNKKGERYVRTDEFRRIQEESRRMSYEDTQLYWNGTKTIDDGLRGRLSRSVKQILMDTGRNGGSNDSRVLNLTAKDTQYNVHENVDGTLFHDVFEIARQHLRYGELVDLHEAETTEEHGVGYNECRNYLSEDGLSGFSITPDGDLISVFNASGKRGFLRAIAPFVKENAKTLDCFISPKQNLQKMYEDIFGFKTASVMDHNMEYDRDNIAVNHNHPKVAFMVNTDADIEVKNFNAIQYDESVDYRNSFINQIAPTETPQNGVFFDAPIGENVARTSETVAETQDVIAPMPEERTASREQSSFDLFMDIFDEDVQTEESSDNAVNVDDPFYDRDIKEVGKRNVNAYMYDNPEVKPFYQSEANIMLGELQRSTKGERHYNDQLYYDTNGEQGFYGTTRDTSDAIAELLDHYNYSYADIEKGLNAIIQDHGAENIAVAKRIEFFINERLLNGYTDFQSGMEIPKNQEYISLIEEMQSKEVQTESEPQLAPIREVQSAETLPIDNSDVQSAKSDGESKPKLTKRGELHKRIMDNMKSKLKERGFDFDEVLKQAKNLSTFRTVDNTPQRVIEKSFGYEVGQVINDLTMNKVAQNETQGIKWLNSFTDRKSGLLAQISKEYGIKPRSKESASAQMYAEGFYVNKNDDLVAYGDRELAIDFPDVDTQNRIKGLAKDSRIRQIYDETLEAINESRTRNGYEAIPRRDNYFLHFRAMEDTFSRIGLPFNPNDIRAKDLPTDLNGMTADLKPGQPYFASAMQRKGNKTSYDLIGGVERYLSSAKNQIYHIDDIQTLRAFRNYIADQYGQANGLENLDTLTEEEQEERIKQVYGSHLSTMAKFLNEEANILAGKTSLVDRGLEGVLGRRGITFLDTVRRQTGSNMVGFNVGSALTNTIPIVQGIAKLPKIDSISALAQMTANKVNNLFGKSDGFVENNTYLIRRKGIEKLTRTPVEKFTDAGFIFMSAIDNVSSEFLVRAKYNELIRKGATESEAQYEADKWTSRLMQDRSLGQMPQLYNSKMLGMLTQFQLEVRNQLDSQFYDTIQEAKLTNKEIEDGFTRNLKTTAKVGSTFLQLAVLQHLFGKGFESLVGYNPAFDIMEVMMQLFGFDDDEESEDTALDNVEQAFLTLLGDLPYTSLALDGGRVPISSALPIKELINGKDAYGNEVSRKDTVMEALPYYLMPTGYGQLKKTSKGLGMFDDSLPTSGSYTDSGNLRFPVEDTPINRLQAGVFGQYANENARYYFDNELAPLKENQIQEYIDLDIPIKDYWQYREGLKEYDTMEEKLDYIAGLEHPLSKKNIMANNLTDRKAPIDMEVYEQVGGLDEYNTYASGRGKYLISQIAGGYDTFKGYATELNNIEADKNAKGEAISGSRKRKVAQYINSLDTDYYTKIILFKSAYPSDNRYNLEIIDYLNSREDITYQDMVEILEELDFTVEANGNVRW